MGNSILKRDKNEIEKTKSYSIAELYDEQFNSLSLTTINKEKQEVADNIISVITNALIDKNIASKTKKVNTNKYDYIVEMSDEMKEAVEKGSIKFDVGKDGKIYAQIREKGKYGKKFSIKKVLSDEGISTEELTSALQIKAIQKQLDEMADTLKNIEQTASEIKQGQQDDRVGLFYSGMNLYLEGRSISDIVFKKYIISQALQSISNANSQLIQQIQTDRNYLLTGGYKKKKGHSYNELQSRMENINKAFEIIYKSTMLKAAIYYDQNELQSMMMVLNEYKHFIENVIIPVVPKLNEFDEKAIELSNSIWEERSNTLSYAESISKQIMNANNYLIDYKEKNDGR